MIDKLQLRIKYLLEELHDYWFGYAFHTHCTFIRKLYNGMYWLSDRGKKE